MSLTFKIEGAKELEETLLSLPDKIAKEIMRDALAAGAEVVLPQAKANAPKGKTGELAANLNIAFSQRGGEVSAFVQTGQGDVAIQKQLKKIRRDAERAARFGTRKTENSMRVGRETRKAAEKKLASEGKKWRGQYYGGMLEFGTKKMTARPWMTRAIETKAAEATEAIGAKLAELLEKSV